MIKELFTILIVQFFFYPLFIRDLYAQIKYKASAETGMHVSAGPDVFYRNDFFNSLEGQLGYVFSDKIRDARIKIRIRPEFYGIQNQLKTMKIRGDAFYHQKENIFNWGFRVNRQRYVFNGRNIDLSYDSFNLILDSDWFLFDRLPFSFSAGYGNQRINNDGSQDLDLYIFDLSARSNLSEFSKLSGGIYFESFNVSGAGNIFYTNIRNNNAGRRYGPHIIFNYIKYTVINFEYRFLYHSSDLTRDFSYEQMISLVAGRFLTEKLSAFLLTDLYFRHYNLNTGSTGNLNLLYNSMNIDNRIFLKIGYDLSGILEVYIRTGYLKENLYENSYSISGWNTVLGIEISN